jgi:hypothetical protein
MHKVRTQKTHNPPQRGEEHQHRKNTSMNTNTTSQPKPEVIRFVTNQPISLILRSQGTSVESRFSHSEQFFYKLDDNRCMYVHPIVHNKLKEQGAQIGDTVTICKRELKPGNAASIIWDAQIDHKAHEADLHKPQAGVQLLERTPSLDEMPDAPERKPPTRLEFALRTALEAAKGAEEYSKSIGRPVMFDKDDIRLMAQTLVINAYRDGRAA